ncbi:PIH1 domain-containing protein 2-like [Montipora foliosa]|uniref:PIH1 domain-containing protein 2-like n=1 Tax=Montipora foliosa TaxID=591990 RepID=UPI0035F14FE8
MAAEKESEILLGQADSVWKMLDDLAESDPEAYKRFIDKTLKEGSTLFKPPEPCFCISTVLLPSVVVTHELFVNICTWEQMPAPKSENDPIPVVAGELQEKAEGKLTYSVVDIIVNPVVTKGIANSKDRRNLLVHVALDYLENTKKIQLSRKYKNSKKAFKGDPKTLRQYLRHEKEHGITPTDGEKQSPKVSDSPGSLLKQLSSIAVSETKPEGTSGIKLFENSVDLPKKALIEEVSSTNFTPQPTTPKYEVLVKDAETAKPRRVIVRMDLPNGVSSSECQLDACENELSLNVPGKCKLRIKLPEKVDPDLTEATFNTTTYRMIVKLPIQLSTKQ